MNRDYGSVANKLYSLSGGGRDIFIRDRRLTMQHVSVFLAIDRKSGVNTAWLNAKEK